MTTQDQSAPAPLPPIAHDIDCIKCGYNLRGLAISGTCPECGAPVAPSANPQRRAARHLRWVNKLRGGLAFCLVGEIAGLLLNLLFMILFIRRPVLSGRVTLLHPASGLWECLRWLYLPVSLLGLWLLTTTDPLIFDPDQRRAYRATRVWAFSLGIFLAAMQFVPRLGLQPRLDIALVRTIWGIVNLSLATGLGIVVTRHLRRLSERMSDAGLAGRCRFLIWLVVGHAACSAGITVVMYFAATDKIDPYTWQYMLRLARDVSLLPILVFKLLVMIQLLSALGRARESLVMMNAAPPRA